jgi:hypothetical protein
MNGTRRKSRGLARAIIVALAAAATLASLGLAASPSPSQSPSPSGSPDPQASPAMRTWKPPSLAYYYMWFTPSSWTHTKTDLPSLGAYDSTDPAVIKQHVAWAKAAGIDAFIVSWKSTPSLNLALAELVSECRAQGLKLVLIYEGLDVNRNPIPAATVETDLLAFEHQYGSDPVFDLYGKTAVIWSGTWRFSDADLAMIRNNVGAPDKMLLLGSEKGAAAYQARASLFDGDAYYWSSADPLATPGYATRLNQLAAAVHATGGLWLAPAAVGFDARLNGGTSTVDRRNGATLTRAWSDAAASNPDGIALISWNEFTENTFVEPSRDTGTRYLQVLSLLTGVLGTSGSTPAISAPPSEAAPAESPSPPIEVASPTLGDGVKGAASTGPARPSTPYSPIPPIIVAGIVLAFLGLLRLSLKNRNGKPDRDDDRRPGSTAVRPR